MGFSMAKRKAVSKNDRALASGITRTEESGSNDLSQYVTTRQAAEILGVVTDHINHLLISRKLRGIKLGYSWLVYVPSIETYQGNKSKRGRPSSRVASLEKAP
jgi:excisionase family DNA binding protein